MNKEHDKGHKGQMSDREAMKLALEALKDIHPGNMTPMAEEYWGKAITALRQALDHVPDPMKMLEPDMGIDRGAWADVPDATKWVNELRGDETEEEPVAFVCRGKLSTIGHCEECEPLYTAPPKREWQGLTDEDIAEGSKQSWVDKQAFESAVWWAEEKLKEKNRG